jgi:hypothetical protein
MTHSKFHEVFYDLLFLFWISMALWQVYEVYRASVFPMLNLALFGIALWKADDVKCRSERLFLTNARKRGKEAPPKEKP